MLRISHVDTHLVLREDSSIPKDHYFYQIIQAAEAGDQLEIDRLYQNEFFTIDVKMGFRFGLITPAGYLEWLGKYAAVDFLLRNGADVDYIAFGSALDGKRTRAEYFRKYHGANVTMIARAAATCDDIYYAERLFIINGADPYDIMLGFLQGAYLNRCIEFINNYKLELPVRRHAEFWYVVGMNMGLINAELIAVWNACRDKSYDSHALDVTYLQHFYRGAGVSDQFDVEPMLDEKLKHFFHLGLIEGNHNNHIPDKFFQAKARFQGHDCMFEFESAMKGCNLNYLIKCLELNKSNILVGHDFYTHYYYYSLQSKNLQLIRNVPKSTFLAANLIIYWHYLPNINCIIHAEQTFKTLSCLHKHRNPDVLKHLSKNDFLWLLPSKEIAMHLMAFDDNDEFQKKLLKQFDQYDWQLQPYLYYDAREAYTAARKIRLLMKKYLFNYDQALAIITSPALRNYLLNTCKNIVGSISVFTKDICTLLVSELGDLSRKDSADLIEKVRHYRNVVQDIVMIAEQFEQYAATHATSEASHANSLAQVLHEVRDNSHALQLLSTEMNMLSSATTQTTQAASSWSSFFNSALQMAKDLYDNNSTPAHLKPYQHMAGDREYEAMLTKSINRLSNK